MKEMHNYYKNLIENKLEGEALMEEAKKIMQDYKISVYTNR